jgi:Flp pilus assembly protein TadG
MKRSRSLYRDTRAAAIVEFVIVIVPLSLAFFSIAQISMLFAAKLVMRHAAVCAVRAYSVIAGPNPGTNGDPNADPILAGTIALGPWYTPGGNGITAADFQFASQATETPPYGYYALDTATVMGVYQCSVPLGRWVACVGGFQTMGPYTASFPHQGARYCTGQAGDGCP